MRGDGGSSGQVRGWFVTNAKPETTDNTARRIKGGHQDGRFVGMMVLFVISIDARKRQEDHAEHVNAVISAVNASRLNMTGLCL